MDEVLPKCYVIGIETVGKSSIIQKFKQNIEIREMDSSAIPITRSNGSILDAEIVEIQIDKQKDTIIGHYNAFVAVYDISNKSSFDAIVDIFNQSHVKPKIKSFPNLIIVGNKCDLNDSREVSIKEGSDLAKKYKDSVFIEASSTQNIKINEIFIKAADGVSKISEKSIDTSCCLMI